VDRLSLEHRLDLELEWLFPFLSAVVLLS